MLSRKLQSTERSRAAIRELLALATMARRSRAGARGAAPRREELSAAGRRSASAGLVVAGTFARSWAMRLLLPLPALASLAEPHLCTLIGRSSGSGVMPRQRRRRGRSLDDLSCARRPRRAAMASMAAGCRGRHKTRRSEHVGAPAAAATSNVAACEVRRPQWGWYGVGGGQGVRVRGCSHAQYSENTLYCMEVQATESFLEDPSNRCENVL